jgi:hydrogenase maturation protease
VGEAVVVIGVGNRDRGDDGVGLEVLSLLAARVPSGARLAAVPSGDPGALLLAWEGSARVILADAMVSGRGPGTVERFDPAAGPLPAGVRLSSTHSLGVAEALELARSLGRLPPSVAVYGVEGSVFGAGEGLSTEVAAGAAEAAERILGELGAQAAVGGTVEGLTEPGV